MTRFQKARSLEKFEGLARAKGPVMFKAARRLENVDEHSLGGLGVLERAGVEDGFMVELEFASKKKISGIIHMDIDLVSGQTTGARLNGVPVGLNHLRGAKILIGRKVAPPQKVPVVHEDYN